MKKKLKYFIAFLFVLSSVFVYSEEFDWSKCWQNYGGSVKENDFIINAGIGLSEAVFDNNNYDILYRMPYFEASVEYTKKIWVLPLGFGGFFGYSSYEGNEEYVYNLSYIKKTMRRSYFDVGALINYHVQLPVKNLDVYTGIRTGAKIRYDSISYEGTSYIPSNQNVTNLLFLFDYRLGATYYFTNLIGANLETGYPVYLKASVSFKL